MRDTNDLLWEEYDMEYQPYKYREMNIERMIGLLKTRGFFFETEFENLPNLGIEKCSHELVDVLKAKSSIKSVLCTAWFEIEWNYIIYNTEIFESAIRLKKEAIPYYIRLNRS